MHAVEKVEGLPAVYRQTEREQHAAVLFALELSGGKGEPAVEVVDHGDLPVVKIELDAVDAVVQEEEEIQDRRAVGLRRLGRGGLLAVCARIVEKERLSSRLVQIGERGKLRCRHAVTELVARHRVDRGESQCVFHLRARAELLEKRLFFFIVAGRYDHSEDIALAEAFADGLLLKLHFILARRGEQRIAVRKIDVAIHRERADEQHHKQNRDYESRAVGKLPDERDLRHEAAVARTVHQSAEGDQQRRHEEEHRKQAAGDGLDQHETEVGAEPELHERHGCETRDRGQTAREDLRNGFGERSLHRRAHSQRCVLLLVAIAEDDRVVHAERKLQDHRNRVRDKRDASHNEVRALLQNGGEQECEHQNGNLGIGLGCEDQHRYDHCRNNQTDDRHFF